MEPKAFQNLIWNYFKNHGRDLPWRHTTDPYHIFVSEVMLQQTQVPRVITKYTEFIYRFPTWASLANATPGEVLKAWQGLGYNRRGLFLYRSAHIVMNEYNGVLPSDPTLLEHLPGIGHATARSIAAFAFNSPVVFIETNIRRIFIHHFFPTQQHVSDADILPLVAKTLPKNRARLWYSALMDYGTTLPKIITNPNRRSAHYTRQSKFEGSKRQIRGNILKYLTQHPNATSTTLSRYAHTTTAIITPILNQLTTEGLIEKKSRRYRLP